MTTEKATRLTRFELEIMRELYGSGPRPATDIMMKDVVDTFRTLTALSGR